MKSEDRKMRSIDDIHALLRQPEVDRALFSEYLYKLFQDVQDRIEEMNELRSLLWSREELFSDGRVLEDEYHELYRQVEGSMEAQGMVTLSRSSVAKARDAELVQSSSPLTDIKKLKELVKVAARKLIYGSGANGWPPDHTQLVRLIDEKMPNTKFLIDHGDNGAPVYQKIPSVISTMISKNIFIHPQPFFEDTRRAVAIDHSETGATPFQWGEEWQKTGEAFLRTLSAEIAHEKSMTDSSVPSAVLSKLEGVISEINEADSADFFHDAFDSGIFGAIDIAWSIRFGLINALKENLLDINQSISMSSSAGKLEGPAIEMAILIGHDKAVDYLIDRFKSTKFDESQLHNLIFKTISNHRPDGLKKLLNFTEDLNFDIRPVVGDHPLGEIETNVLGAAVFFGSTKCIPLLLEKAPELIEGTDIYGRTPVQMANTSENPEVADLLKNYVGETARNA